MDDGLGGIELSLFRQIENRDLMDHIVRVGIDFYRRYSVEHVASCDVTK